MPTRCICEFSCSCHLRIFALNIIIRVQFSKVLLSDCCHHDIHVIHRRHGHTRQESFVYIEKKEVARNMHVGLVALQAEVTNPAHMQNFVQVQNIGKWMHILR